MLVAILFVLLLCLVLALVAFLAMLRQLRIGREALAPVGSTARAQGEREHAPIVSAPSVTGEMLTIGGASHDPRSLLLLFIEPRSPLCEAVVSDALALTRARGVRLLLLGEGASQAYEEILEGTGIAGADMLLGDAIAEDFRIGPAPSAALIDANGHIVARGTVQRRDQLEDMLGIASSGMLDAAK